MPLDIRYADERGNANFGWLQSRHTFSFGHYYDPAHMGFSDLRVINDDRVAAGYGFETHPHLDMEIFSYVLSGALAHKDSMGVGSTIHAGDVQLMSAGTGVLHSEFNASDTEPVHFLQIWLLPNQRGLPPNYQQTHFSAAQKQGKWCLLLSPTGENDSLRIHQDAYVYATVLTEGEALEFNKADHRYVYVHVARGQLALNGQLLQAGDGVRIRHESSLRFDQAQQAEVLLFDLKATEGV